MYKRKKVNFEKIWKLIVQIDGAVGGFLFGNSLDKTKKIDKFLAATWPMHAVITVIFVVSTLLVTKCKLIYVIFCIALLVSFLMIYATVTKLILNKDTLKHLLDWCQDLYNVEKKFYVCVQTVAETHLLRMERQTEQILTWFRVMLYFDVFAMTIGFAIVGNFLPESIYPKYSSPLPFYLPFKHQETWLACITTTGAQALLFILTVSLILEFLGVFFCITIHLSGFLDIVHQIITEKFKQELQTKFMTGHDIEPKPSTSRLQVSTLVTISQEIETSNKNTTSFNDWILILTEMICDVNSIMTSFSKLYTEFLLLFEMTSLGCLFITGLTFIILRQQYFFALGISVAPCLLFVFCYINEKLLDKFNGIKEALYDIPWYDLTPQEQKTLLIIMNCDKIQKGFTAAGIHSMTVERFGIIIKVGYTNLLVLKDLVKN